jgi:predicted GNAT family N-acyltransferase
MFTIAETTWQKNRTSLSTIREQVFIKEQKVPIALEWDGLDETAVHLIAWDFGGVPIGCARLLSDYQLGRMAVLPENRMQGVGTALLLAAVEYAAEVNWSHISISAQTQAIGFYMKSGFVLTGGEYMDAGIPHRDMCLYII